MSVILIVEDDEFISLFLKNKMKTRHQIVEARTAADAWKALRAQKVDLVLLDILLPDINGFTFLKQCKQQAPYKDIPVIIISNLGQQNEKERGLQLGAADYLIKSNHTPSAIAARVEAVLQQHGKPSTA